MYIIMNYENGLLIVESLDDANDIPIFVGYASELPGQSPSYEESFQLTPGQEVCADFRRLSDVQNGEQNALPLRLTETTSRVVLFGLQKAAAEQTQNSEEMERRLKAIKLLINMNMPINYTAPRTTQELIETLGM
jgi:hypothetical protein